MTKWENRKPGGVALTAQSWNGEFVGAIVHAEIIRLGQIHLDRNTPPEYDATLTGGIAMTFEYDGDSGELTIKLRVRIES